MNLEEQLEYIQHNWIPWSFYNAAVPLLHYLIAEKGKVFTKLFDVMNQDDSDFRCPYTESDFQFDFYKLRHTEGAVFRITMPEPKQATLCHQVFLAFSSDFKQRFYYTLELTADGDYLLCGWDIKHNYIIFDFDYSGDDNEVLAAVDTIFATSDIEKLMERLKNWS